MPHCFRRTQPLRNALFWPGIRLNDVAGEGFGVHSKGCGVRSKGFGPSPGSAKYVPCLTASKQAKNKNLTLYNTF
jgi:hypothetical protein